MEIITTISGTALIAFTALSVAQYVVIAGKAIGGRYENPGEMVPEVKTLALYGAGLVVSGKILMICLMQ